MDSIYKRRFVDKSDNQDKADRPLVQGRTENRHGAKQEHFVKEIRFNRGGEYERVRDDNKYVRCIDKTDVSDEENKTISKRNSVYDSDDDNSELDSISDNYSEDSEKDYSDNSIVNNDNSDYIYTYRDSGNQLSGTNLNKSNLKDNSKKSCIKVRKGKTKTDNKIPNETNEDSDMDFADEDDGNDDDNDGVCVNNRDNSNLIQSSKRRRKALLR